ncbi:unnamed protein product [Orchesella dallaii]|uniref:Uncharacterized protein n=1 Tax=Orchesella dallaii TaxID=48710 RepID=A0ABP1PR95_9HEXA
MRWHWVLIATFLVQYVQADENNAEVIDLKEFQPIEDKVLDRLLEKDDGPFEKEVKKLIAEYLVASAVESATNFSTEEYGRALQGGYYPAPPPQQQPQVVYVYGTPPPATNTRTRRTRRPPHHHHHHESSEERNTQPPQTIIQPVYVQPQQQPGYQPQYQQPVYQQPYPPQQQQQPYPPQQQPPYNPQYQPQYQPAPQQPAYQPAPQPQQPSYQPQPQQEIAAPAQPQQPAAPQQQPAQSAPIADKDRAQQPLSQTNTSAPQPSQQQTPQPPQQQQPQSPQQQQPQPPQQQQPQPPQQQVPQQQQPQPYPPQQQQPYPPPPQQQPVQVVYLPGTTPAAPTGPTTTPRPRPSQQHVYNQVNKILDNVGTGNIPGIVDSALGIRTPAPTRNFVNGILNTVFCNPINRLLGRCRGERKFK